MTQNIDEQLQMTSEERWIALNEIFRAEGLVSETHALEWLIQQYRLKKLMQSKAPWDDNTDNLETINKRMELKESDWRATFEPQSQSSGALDAIGYDSSGNVIGTFTVPPQMAQQLSQRMSNVSVGYQIQIVEKEKGD